MSLPIQSYSLSDVFNESDLPVLTFVQPSEFDDMVGSLVTAGKHLTLSGPSGCGKTTLAKKALEEAQFGPGNTVWISGRDHTSAFTVGDLFSKALSCSNLEDDVVALLAAAGIVVLEPARELWRLQPLRRWSHEQVEQVLT